MTLKQLPDFALFTFVKGIAHYPPSCVWQKLSGAALSPSKDITWHHIVKVKKVGKGFLKDHWAMSAISGHKKVTLVARRRNELKYPSHSDRPT